MDYSPSFLEYAKSLSIRVKKADLLNFQLTEDYDLITTFHTLFAFSKTDQSYIITNILKGLNKNGVYIFDIPNLEWKDESSISYAELSRLIDEVDGSFKIKIIRHDFYDQRFIHNIKSNYRRLYLTLYIIYFRLRLYSVLDSIESLMPARCFQKSILIIERIS